MTTSPANGNIIEKKGCNLILLGGKTDWADIHLAPAEGLQEAQGPQDLSVWVKFKHYNEDMNSSRYYTYEELEGELTVDINCGLWCLQKNIGAQARCCEFRKLKGGEVATQELCSHLR